MGNSSGSYHTTHVNTMRAYDKLPPSARKALQDSVFCWATQPLLTAFNRGKTGPQIAENISNWDKALIRKEALKVWGIGHPSCDGIAQPRRTRGKS